MSGIGGRTIAEAQERMSLREFQMWVKINKAKNTPPYKVSDFAPHINEASVSLEEAMNSWE